MSDFSYSIISEVEAAAAILQNRGNFVPWLGAGVSVASSIPGAQQICDDLKLEFINRELQGRRFYDANAPELTSDEERELIDEALSWFDPSIRYAQTIRRLYPRHAERVDYFRNLVGSSKPCFAHYAVALLTNSRIFSTNCLTTNFDKLLERAYHEIGAMECQAIRASSELQYHLGYADKAFCLKVHGDYDTHNILNTAHETTKLDEAFTRQVEDVLRDKGAIVLGSAGAEKSIHTLFDHLTSPEARERRTLKYGLLWGVYVPEGTSDPVNAVRNVIDKRGISREIVRMMDRSRSDTTVFSFFPLSGASQFLWNIFRLTKDEALLDAARPFLDHDIRIADKFSAAKLPLDAARDHVERLKKAQKRLAKAAPPDSHIVAINEARLPGTRSTVTLCYGSMSDRRLLTQEKGTARCISAVLSPDDTLISIGGGTALAIAEAAGKRQILHEVSKLAPIEWGDVAVTSGGQLPVEYILHGASVRIGTDGLRWSKAYISRTVRSALKKARAIGVNVLFVPLLAAGTGNAPADVSVSRILAAMRAHALETEEDGIDSPIKTIIVVFQEKELSRQAFLGKLDLLRRIDERSNRGRTQLDAAPFSARQEPDRIPQRIGQR